VPNEIKTETRGLVAAGGVNTNVFYRVNDTPKPVISEKATISPPDLKMTYTYDFPTTAGGKYVFISK
jgi:alpha-L-fucosidase 2